MFVESIDRVKLAIHDWLEAISAIDTAKLDYEEESTIREQIENQKDTGWNC